MKSTTNLTLNLSLPNIAQIAYAVQGDQLGRELTIQLVDGSVPWEPPANALPTVRYRKPDGTTGFYDTMEDGTTPAVTVSGSTATLRLANQALTVPGVVLMQLNFYSANDGRVTTFAWSLIVQPSVLTDAMFISTDYYNILSQQIAAVLEAAASLAGLTATAIGLPTGSDPTVTVTGGSGGVPYNLAFAIPAGPVGPPEIPTTTSEYQAGASPTEVPTGAWLSSPPAVAQGAYLWTRTTLSYSDGTDAVYYTVSRQGVDGQGAPGSALPLMDGVAAAGSSVNFSREDHVHPSSQLITETALAIPAEGASVAYDMPGLTENHRLTQWNFSESAENFPPVDLTCTTYAGYFIIVNTSGSTSETMQPVFEIPTAIAVTTH